MPLHFKDPYLHNLFQVSLVLASSCPQGELLKSSSEQENIRDTQTCMPEGLRSLYTALHKPKAVKFWVLQNTFLSHCLCMSPVSFSSYQYTWKVFINTFSYFSKKISQNMTCINRTWTNLWCGCSWKGFCFLPCKSQPLWIRMDIIIFHILPWLLI